MQKDNHKLNYNWIISTSLIAFLISLFFTLFSEIIISNINIFLGILLVLFFILIGIIFDIIGIATTLANIKPFHAMNSRKMKGANIAIVLKKNAPLVASYANDVIGDICGIISGSTSIIISIIIATKLNINPFGISILFTSIVASVTIGGKAIGKVYAINNSNNILYNFSKFISYIPYLEKIIIKTS